MTQRGFIVVADITGYTKFLTGSELDHAQGVLGELLAAMLAKLESPLSLSNIQGDAVLAHAPEANVPDGATILDAVDILYWAFKQTVEHMQRNTTCECAACSNIPQLDLKMVVHFGDYVETSLAGRQELSGPDVILVHRLLKNAIVEDTGIAAYAAYTEAAVATIGMDEVFAQAVAHHENTEEFGDVVLRVMDLTPGWQAHREASRIRVADDAPRWFEDISIDLAVPPDRVWFHLIHPEQRSKWGLGVIGLDREGTDRGRVVPGTTDHCAHGDGSTLIYTIVDVAPFESYSIEVALPMGGRIRTSLFLDAVDGGTRVNLRCAKPEAGSALVTGLLGLMARSQAKTVREAWFSGLTKLQELCRQEVADGVLTAVDATAFDAEAISGVARGLASAEG